MPRGTYKHRYTEVDGDDVGDSRDDAIVGSIPVIHRIVASTLTGDVDVVLTHKTRVIDAWCVPVGAGAAADTITVKNAANAITDAMDCNVADNVMVRAAQIADANHEIAAGGTLRITGASAVSCIVYVLGVRVP